MMMHSSATSAFAIATTAFLAVSAFLPAANASLSLRPALSVLGLADSNQAPLRHIQTNDNDNDINSWSIHTLAEFPGYSLRTRVQTEALCDPDVRQVVGYVDVDPSAENLAAFKHVPPSSDPTAKHFFFWFFESRRNPDSDPLVLWLNGGPGCSSMTGLLMELGPCRVSPGGNGTDNNPYSWNNEANIIFLDQPVNVGFSYSEDAEQVSTTDAAADDVYAFLQLFLSKFPKYAKNSFHVTGESYAGHYIPAIGNKIFEENNLITRLETLGSPAANSPIKLRSLAIGNGLTDPLIQYKYYTDMAADETYGPVLPEQTINEMRSKIETCTRLISSCYQYQNRLSCVPAGLYCNSALISPFQSSGLNIYDVRKKCDPSKNPLCYDIIKDIDIFLNDEAVQRALGVDRKFEGCKMDINGRFALAGDWMRPYVHDLPPLLEAGIRVLIYAGDADFICNWIGNKAWITELEWSGKESFQKAEDREMKSKITGRKAGVIREYKNLAFLRIFEAGHMVPYDQPEHSSEFINAWLAA